MLKVGGMQKAHAVSRTHANFALTLNSFRILASTFRSLASKVFPSAYSTLVCVRLHALRKLRTYEVIFANDA